MTEFKYLRWYRFGGSLSCEPYGSLLDAVHEIDLLQWSDDAYLYEECGIEGPAGWVSPSEERDVLAEHQLGERQRAADRPKPEPLVVRLSVQALGSESDVGEWAVYDEFTARQIQNGWAERDRLVELVGAERVQWEGIE